MVELGYAIWSEVLTERPRPPRPACREGRQAMLRLRITTTPWMDKQGHSPFVWSVIGGIAQASSTLHLGTGVTCPTVRMHPAIIAQSAATSMPGRFFLGVGSGENLNEHIPGRSLAGDGCAPGAPRRPSR